MLKVKKISQKNVSTIFTLLKNSAEMFFKFYIIILIFLFTKSIPAVFCYVLLQSIIYFLITLFGKNFLKTHAKQLLLFSIIPFILMHLMFFVSINNVVFIIFISFFSASYTSITWLPFNTISSTQNQSILMSSLVNLISVAIALLSGFSLDLHSIYYVVVVGVVLYFVAVIVAYCLYDFNNGLKLANSSLGKTTINSLHQQQSTEIDSNKNEVFSNTTNINNKQNKQLYNINYKPWLAEMFVALIFVIECVWMVFVYIKYQKFSSVGIVRSLVLIGSFISTIIITKVKNRKLKTFLSIAAILLASASYVYRVYAFYDATVFALSFLIGFLTPMFLLPLGQMYLKSNYNYKNSLEANFAKSSYKRLVSIPFTILVLIINSLSFSIVIFSLLLSYLSVQFTTKK